MEVIVGTYNHVLFGFSFGLNEEDNSKWSFKPLFTDQGHAGCIKSVSTGGRYLASGSTDETIRLFDLKKHTEVGTLVQQDGSITSLAFSGTTHMLSGSEDGTICIWKTKTWELEKTMKGHKASINALSIHPTGRLALSVSKDKTIRTWNLLTGRTAYTTGLKEVGEIVHWSPSGDTYAIVVGSKVTVYQIKGVKDPVVYKCEKPILAMVFLSADVLVLAGESSDIIVYNFQKKLVLQRIAAHKVRTKGLSIVPYPGGGDENKVLMFTVASSGNLKAWVLDKGNLNEEAQFLASLDLPGRPTCLTVKPQLDNNIIKPTKVVEAVKADKQTPVPVEEKEVDASADDKQIQSEHVDSTSEGVENQNNNDAENSIGSLSIKSSHESLESTEIEEMQSDNPSPDGDMEEEEEEEEEIEKDKENTPVPVDSPVDSPTDVNVERSSTKSSLSVGTGEADSTTESDSMSLSKESTMESITGSTTDSLMDTSSSQASEDSTSKSTSVKSTTVKKGKKKKKFNSDSSSISSSSTKEVKKKKKKKSINVGD